MKIRLLLLLLLSIGNIVQTNAAILDIRRGSSGDPLSGLTVTWRNTGRTDSIKWGYANTYEKGVAAGVRRNGIVSGSYFFKYVFSNAIPHSTIYYKLYDSGTKTWGTEMTYQTAPPVNTTKFSFLAIGDSRSGLSIWKQVSNLANTKKAAFTIFNGDIVAAGGTNSDWDNWFINGKTFIQNNLIYHSLGNHEVSGSGTAKYQNIFEMPVNTSGTNLYYSVVYGNAIFISLNSEAPSNTAQYNWLVNTLKANQDKTWKIIFFHRPFYTIGSHAGEMNAYFNTWWKAFDDYGVDLIANGHDHMYERTKPINRKVSTTQPVTKYGSGPGEGRCQIVCGGAGAPLYSGSANAFMQKVQSKYHFCKFDVDGPVLKGIVYDNNNAVLDSFVINKTTVVGVEDKVLKNQEFNPISVFPNPVINQFTLKYSSQLKGEAVIKIYDMTGKVVATENIRKNGDDLEFQSNMSGYPKGAYFIQVVMGEQTDDVMIMVQ